MRRPDEKYLDADYDGYVFRIGTTEYPQARQQILITLNTGNVAVTITLWPNEASDLINGLKRAVKDYA